MGSRTHRAGGLPLVTVAAFLVILASPLVAGSGQNLSPSAAAQIEPQGPGLEEYGATVLTPHSPIRIESDAGFNATNGVVSGNGTPGAPFLISGWSIQRNGTTSGILVANTTKHFVLATANITGGDTRGHAIVLTNLTNGSVRDSELGNHSRGIWAFRAPGVLIRNVTTHDVSVGVYVEKSDRVAITNSGFRTSSQYGVLVSFSDNFTASNSTFTMVSESGFLFDSDFHFRVEDSTFTGGRAAFELSASYYGNVSGNLMKDISGDGMLIQSSNHITISNNRFINNSVGILALISNYNTIEDNLVESCYNGLLFDKVYSSVLSRNRVLNSTVAGLQLNAGGLNTFRNNSFAGNYYDLDIRALPDFPETLGNDIDMSNTVGGRPVFVARDLKDPVVPGNAGYVVLVNVTGNVSGLNISGQGQGVLIGFSENLTLSSSNFTANAQGVSVVGSENVTVANITVTDGYEAGVIFDGVHDSEIRDSRVIAANLSGVNLLRADRNRLSGNVIEGTLLGPAIKIEADSHDNLIRGNTIRGSKSLGVQIADRQHGNEISWNDFVANKVQADDLSPPGQNAWNGVDRGNFWDDHDNTDANCDGASDLFYIIGSKGSRDFKPQVKSIAASVPPCPPTGLKAQSTGPEIALVWTTPVFDGDAAISKYNVYRRPTTGPFALVATTNATKHIDTPPEFNATYSYHVTAVNSAGEGKNSADVETKTFWVPPKLPDGQAQEIFAEPAHPVAGDSVRLRGVVVNIGPAALDSAHARLFSGDAVGSALLAESNVPKLLPGQRYDLVASWSAVVGSHVFTLVLDQVTPGDGDQSNNEASVVVEVAEKPGNGGNPGAGPPSERAAWSPVLLGSAAALLVVALVIGMLASRKSRARHAIQSDTEPEPESPPAPEKSPEPAKSEADPKAAASPQEEMKGA